MNGGRIAVESYGCTMNKGESRRAASILSGLGYDILFGDSPEISDTADTVLLFTCDVISTTERKMWKRMEELASSGKNLFVAGCLVHIKGKEILDRYPKAVLLDSMGVERLGNSIEKEFPSVNRDQTEIMNHDTGRLDHIVTLSTGCLGSCTYCITRVSRGGHISNSPVNVIEGIRWGRSKGRREILLTSQDTGAYGIDLEPRIDLGILLKMITSEGISGVKYRVGMMNPDHMMQHIQSILDGYDHPTVFKFFHIPVQSGSNEILRRMGRRYDAEKIPGLFSSIRNRFPGAVISTDMITGFPGETMEDHSSSLEMVRSIEPDILNITRFSRREGTPADLMKDQVPGWVAKERSRELSRIHGEILEKRLKDRLGTHEGCLVTEVGKPGTMMARDGNYLPIVIEGSPELLGTFQDIETDSVGTTYLKGHII